ncbi:MAG: hypothetical protein HHJ10_03960 [Cellulomonas sp.]|nr:hypothetical protein [Cellulomonas sp.]
MVTNRGVRAAFALATTSRARFSWTVRVMLSRTRRLRENAQTGRQEVGCWSGSQTSSAGRAGSLSGFRNLIHYIARSLLEAGGFRPRLHP